MRAFPTWTFVLCVLSAACGGDDGTTPGTGTAGSGGFSGAGATPGGGAGSGGAGAGGASLGGAGTSGASGAMSDGCATIGGTPTGKGACYVPCVYDGSLVPTYDRNGDCTKFGSKCGNYNYCMPDIMCTADANCGTGRACGLGGQCMIACATDADCPAPSSGSPLQCKPVDTGTLVCRPFP